MAINLNPFKRKKPTKPSKKYRSKIEKSKVNIEETNRVITKRQTKIEKIKYSNVKNMVIGKVKWYNKIALNLHLIKSKKELQMLKIQLKFEKKNFEKTEKKLVDKVNKLLSNVKFEPEKSRGFEQLKINVNSIKEIIDAIDQTIMKIDELIKK